jgi:hypothetical protein
MPCPPHPPWLYHFNYIWRRVLVMKLLIMQFSPPAALGLGVGLTTTHRKKISLLRNVT